MITIIDYGMGNLGSISNMIKRIGHKCLLTSDTTQIDMAGKIIFPGVGHFDKAMQNIKSLGLLDVIRKKALIDKVPILGICLGMQIMCKNSEEGKEQGLGLIDATVKRFCFPEDKKIKVPHMGWNWITIKKDNLLFSNGIADQRFYFVHSYHVICSNQDDVLTTTDYGLIFHSSFSHKNILGVQFHPEKSHKFGMHLFKNFIENY